MTDRGVVVEGADDRVVLHLLLCCLLDQYLYWRRALGQHPLNVKDLQEQQGKKTTFPATGPPAHVIWWSYQITGGPTKCLVFLPNVRWSYQISGGPTTFLVVLPNFWWSYHISGGPTKFLVVIPNFWGSYQMYGGPTKYLVVCL